MGAPRCRSSAFSTDSSAPTARLSVAPGSDPGVPHARSSNVERHRQMEQRTTPPPTVIDATRKYSVTVHTSRGDFVIALVEPKVAPLTVNNFVYLAQNHHYDGLTFHRVVPGFVVQGGDPLGNGTGGPRYKLPGESIPSQGPRGTVGMASSAAGVSGAQFFITLGGAPFLASNGVDHLLWEVSAGVDG